MPQLMKARPSWRARGLDGSPPHIPERAATDGIACGCDEHEPIAERREGAPVRGESIGLMETGRSWYKSAIRSQRVKDAMERVASEGKRTGGGPRPFGYKIIRQDLGEAGRRRWRIDQEELEPAEAEAIKEAAARVLRGESLRSIAMDDGVRRQGGSPDPHRQAR
jgi:hypothetical protein